MSMLTQKPVRAELKRCGVIVPFETGETMSAEDEGGSAQTTDWIVWGAESYICIILNPENISLMNVSGKILLLEGCISQRATPVLLF